MPEIAWYWQANKERRLRSRRQIERRSGDRRSWAIFDGEVSRNLITPQLMRLRGLLILAVANLIATSTFAQLTGADVTTIINQAVIRASKVSPNSVIAVTDREGYVLGIWVVRGGAATPGEIATAVSKAGTAAYLSSDQNAFTSRTAGYIIQQHFPVGVSNTAPGPLVGVGLSNLFISDVNHFKKTDLITCPFPPPTPAAPSPGTFGSPIAFTSLDGSPGGVPLYKNGELVGGVGGTGDGTPQPAIPYLPTPPFPPFAPCIFASLPPPGGNARDENPFIYIGGSDVDEDVALAGQKGFGPSSSITANNVFIGGIRLPYVGATSRKKAKGGAVIGNADPSFPIVGSPPPFPYPVATFSGVDGQIRQPIISDPLVGPISGQPRLTAAEVASIIDFAPEKRPFSVGTWPCKKRAQQFFILATTFSALVQTWRCRRGVSDFWRKEIIRPALMATAPSRSSQNRICFMDFPERSRM